MKPDNMLCKINLKLKKIKGKNNSINFIFKQAFHIYYINDFIKI